MGLDGEVTDAGWGGGQALLVTAQGSAGEQKAQLASQAADFHADPRGRPESYCTN